MVDVPYQEYHKDDMILRDFLALHRTKLANERTFLAYTRTSLGLGAAGLTFIKVFSALWIQIIGWILFPSGIMLFIFGVLRFILAKLNFEKLEEEDQPETTTEKAPQMEVDVSAQD